MILVHCALVFLFSAKQRSFVSSYFIHTHIKWASQLLLVVKNPPANTRDLRGMGLIPGWERSIEGGHGNPLQYSCLENPMDRGA